VFFLEMLSFQPIRKLILALYPVLVLVKLLALLPFFRVIADESFTE